MQDLTKITTPVSLLKVIDHETYNALAEYSGPLQFWADQTSEWADYTGDILLTAVLTVRAKPQPVRGEVVVTGWVDETGSIFSDLAMGKDTHRLTLPTIDGALIAGEYRDDAGNVIKLEVL